MPEPPTNSCEKNLPLYGLEWLNSLNLKFPIPSSNVSILTEPNEFFQEIKRLSSEGKKRISIASLYIGTTQPEIELVDSIRSALEVNNNDLEVNILLDYNRGSRGKNNSRTLLLPLLKDFGDKVNVSLYYSPNLRGWLGKLLPERWNETVSLCHLKIYVFDDTLIMSGANLSDQYFSDRQDRYIVFKNCPDLSSFFHDLLKIVSTFSFQVNSTNKVNLHPTWKIHPLLGNQKQFISEAHARLIQLLDKAQPSSNSEASKNSDTLVYPLVQMKHLGISTDEKVTNQFFKKASGSSEIKLASGYFNLTADYTTTILKLCKAKVDILAASPKVNGFFGANGAAGYIPMIYTCLEKEFFQLNSSLKQIERVKLYEYERNLWTFHAKGIWYYPSASSLPVLSFVGSPNFGYRSVYRDLEAQVILVTSNPDLQKKLHLEQQRLYQSCAIVTESTFQRRERKIPILIRIATKILKTFF